jgi:4-hydroxyphenylpyruvate dioxygenase
MEPTVEKMNTEVVRAGIYTGETVHVYGERKTIRVLSYQVTRMEIRLQSKPTGLKYIDHMVGNVERNEMNTGSAGRRSNGFC